MTRRLSSPKMTRGAVFGRTRMPMRRTARARPGCAGDGRNKLQSNFSPRTPEHHGRRGSARDQRARRFNKIENPRESAKPPPPVQIRAAPPITSSIHTVAYRCCRFGAQPPGDVGVHLAHVPQHEHQLQPVALTLNQRRAYARHARSFQEVTKKIVMFVVVLGLLRNSELCDGEGSDL